jgi:putative serine protease PepD
VDRSADVRDERTVQLKAAVPPPAPAAPPAAPAQAPAPAPAPVSDAVPPAPPVSDARPAGAPLDPRTPAPPAAPPAPVSQTPVPPQAPPPYVPQPPAPQPTPPPVAPAPYAGHGAHAAHGAHGAPPAHGPHGAHAAPGGHPEPQQPAATAAFGAPGLPGPAPGQAPTRPVPDTGDPYAPYANAPGAPGGPQGPEWGAAQPAPGPKRRGIGSLVATVLVAAVLAGGIGGGVGYLAADHHNDSTTVTNTSTKGLSRPSASVAGIAKKALPSVVTIKASGSQESGTGTGFVYDRQGHILTNNHVVAPAADGGKLTATFSDGRTYTAEVVGRAQGYDVAVIKLKGISPSKLTPLTLGNSDNAAVGDATIAIGAPFGLSGTVTTGIVSATHRPVASSDGEGSAASYMSAIQTDASINPGNSGGPLLNAQGAVIGIDSAIQSTGSSEGGSQSGSIGLGFAIPINQAERVAKDLINTGTPIYPVIGVQVDPSYSGTGAKISTSTGAVTAGGPAAKAGLRSGDIITKFGATVIDSSPTLIAEIWQHKPGEKVTLTYTRSGQSHTVTLTLGERKGDS